MPAREEVSGSTRFEIGGLMPDREEDARTRKEPCGRCKSRERGRKQFLRFLLCYFDISLVLILYSVVFFPILYSVVLFFYSNLFFINNIHISTSTVIRLYGACFLIYIL